MHFGGKIPDFDQDHLSGRVKVDYLLLPRWLLGEKTQKPGCNCQGFSQGGANGLFKILRQQRPDRLGHLFSESRTADTSDIPGHIDGFGG